MNSIFFKIYKWNPYYTKKPIYLNYKFNLNSKLNFKMDLDNLIWINNNNLNFNLSFRKSCREGICGSCAMNINGLNSLACLTSTKFKNIINPLPHLPIRKDLIIDFKWFYSQLFNIKPWIFSKNYFNRWLNKSIFSRKINQNIYNRKKLDGLYECILCACCSTSCPSYWWNHKKYLGPAILLQSYRWLVDSKDFAFSLRLNNLVNPFKVYRCHMILNCSQTCPKGLKPSIAINSLKKYISQHILI